MSGSLREKGSLKFPGSGVPSDSLACARTATTLARKLRGGIQPAAIALLGDSTGNDPTDWFRPFVAWLAQQFPNITTQHFLWSDTDQRYSPTGVVASGAAGDRYYQFATNTDYISVPDSAATSITGDIDVRVKVALDAWTPGITSTIVGKNGAAGQRAWWFDVTTAKLLSWTWSADGTNFTTKFSATLPFADGEVGWVRAAFDVDNGASGSTLKFYTSTNGTTWTQLGSDIVTAGATSIFDNTTSTQLIGRGGNGIVATGKAYALQVRNGIDGAPVIDIDLGAMPTTGSTFTDWVGNTCTVNGTGTRAGSLVLAAFNASTSGQAIAYSNDVTRFGKQTPYPLDEAFISYGHNENTTTAYRAAYKTLTDALIAKYADVGIIAVTQNPQTAPRTQAQYDSHALRFEQVRAFAASQRFGLIDAHRGFLDDGRAISALVDSSDGVHPTAAGNLLWTDIAMAAIRPWLLPAA